MQSKNIKLGVFLTLLGGAFWGFSGVCGEFLFTQKGISAAWLVPHRLIISGAAMLAFFAVRFAARGQFARLFAPLSPRHAASVLAFALLGLMMVQFSYFRAIELSNAAIATVIQYSAPIFILAVVCWRERRRPSWRELAALVLAVGGVFFLATHAQLSRLVISPLALFWCAASAVCVVFYNLCALREREEFGVGLVLAWGLFIAGVVLCGALRVWRLGGVTDAAGAAAVFGVIFFGTICAFGLYLKGVELIGAARASFIAAVEPVSAAVVGAVWLGTRLGGWDALGFVMILACVWLLGRR